MWQTISPAHFQPCGELTCAAHMLPICLFKTCFYCKDGSDVLGGHRLFTWCKHFFLIFHFLIVNNKTLFVLWQCSTRDMNHNNCVLSCFLPQHLIHAQHQHFISVITKVPKLKPSSLIGIEKLNWSPWLDSLIWTFCPIIPSSFLQHLGKLSSSKMPSTERMKHGCRFMPNCTAGRRLFSISVLLFQIWNKHDHAKDDFSV